MQREINVQPISDSEVSEEDDAEFASPQADMYSPASAPADARWQSSAKEEARRSSSAEYDDPTAKPSVAVQASSAAAANASDGSDLDDSLRIKDLDTGREMLIQQVTALPASCQVLCRSAYAAWSGTSVLAANLAW